MPAQKDQKLNEEASLGLNLGYWNTYMMIKKI